MRGSTVVFMANDIQHAVGLLTLPKGLGMIPNIEDRELNIIIDPTADVLVDYYDDDDTDLDDDDS